MLTKRSKRVLEALNRYPTGEKTFFSMDEIERLCNISLLDAKLICLYLEKFGYLRGQRDEHMLTYAGEPRLDGFEITEEGKCYKELEWRQFQAYIADKWIDFFALLLSIISIVLSILTLTGILQVPPQ